MVDRSADVCGECVKEDSLFKEVGAAFDYEGPAASLIKRLKDGSEPHLAKAAGAFLAAQWANLKWPFPDLIVPVPQRFSHWIGRGYNQSQLLAESFGKRLSRPVVPLLSCKGAGMAQTGLSKEQRKQIPQGQFLLKKNVQMVEDKTICLVDDVMTTGTTLRACAKAILKHSPAQIYALTFCRTAKTLNGS
jgi:ComF family protein